MTRSGHIAFVKDTKDKKEPRSYCRLCEEKYSKLNLLVPRLDSAGVADDKFVICQYCNEIYPRYEIKIESSYEPKGYLNPNQNPFSSGTKVSVLRNKRLTKKGHKKEGLEKIQIDQLAGREDVELQEMLSTKSRPAILNMISDTIVEDSDLEY